MFKDKNIKNVFGQSDDGFRSRFNHTLSTLQAMEKAMPSPKKRARRAAKQPDSHFGWVQFTGTLVATCMIAALLWGVATYWNNTQAPVPEENSIGTAVGSGEEPLPSADLIAQVSPSEINALDVYNGPSIYNYKNIVDDFTELQTIDEIRDMAIQIHSGNLITQHYCPEEFVNEAAMGYVNAMFSMYIDPHYTEVQWYYFEENLEDVRALARFMLDSYPQITYPFDYYWAARTNFTEAEIPWYDGTNADAPVLRYEMKDAPEAIQNQVVNGEDCFDTLDGRFWRVLQLERDDLAIGYTNEVIYGMQHVFLFYLDQEQKQEDEYLIISIDPSFSSGAYSARVSHALSNSSSTFMSMTGGNGLDSP